jgi:hypothetical protein
MLHVEQAISDPQTFPILDDQLAMYAKGVTKTVRESAAPLAATLFRPSAELQQGNY